MSMAAPTVVVTGATGNVGSALVPELAGRGAAVRALVHDPAKADGVVAAGAEPVVGEFGRPDSYAAAFQGADALFVLAPNDPDQVAWERDLAATARAAGLQRVVKLSVANADPGSPVSLYRTHGECEEAVREAGVGVTVLRCCEFMQNFLLSAETLRTDGALYGTGVGAEKVAFVDVRDVAAVAAELLTGDGPAGAEYLLTGPEAITFDEAAGRLGAALGTPIAYVEVPADEYRGALVDDGVPGWYADVLVELYESYGRGVAAKVTDVVPALTGRPARTVDDFARDHAAQLSGAAA
jgi:uncharacterized protein YbjT (DUF2867 family)